MAGKTRGRKRKFTEKDVISALIVHNGCKIKAAKTLDCSRTTLDGYIATLPEVKKAYNEIIEGKIDIAEGVLFEMVEKGHFPALALFLKTIGKRRGYVEGRQQTVFELTEKAKNILSRLRDGEITASNAALSFELEGLPIPDSVRLILAREEPEPVDSSGGMYATISDEEMERRVAERQAAIASQRENLPERRAEVSGLRNNAIDSFSETAQGEAPRG